MQYKAFSWTRHKLDVGVGLKYKIGDVVVIDAAEARKCCAYDGPAVVTIGGFDKDLITVFFQETAYCCGIDFIVGYATELLKELV